MIQHQSYLNNSVFQFLSRQTNHYLSFISPISSICDLSFIPFISVPNISLRLYFRFSVFPYLYPYRLYLHHFILTWCLIWYQFHTPIITYMYNLLYTFFFTQLQFQLQHLTKIILSHCGICHSSPILDKIYPHLAVARLAIYCIMLE